MITYNMAVVAKWRHFTISAVTRVLRAQAVAKSTKCDPEFG